MAYKKKTGRETRKTQDVTPVKPINAETGEEGDELNYSARGHAGAAKLAPAFENAEDWAYGADYAEAGSEGGYEAQSDHDESASDDYAEYDAAAYEENSDAQAEAAPVDPRRAASSANGAPARSGKKSHNAVSGRKKRRRPDADRRGRRNVKRHTLTAVLVSVTAAAIMAILALSLMGGTGIITGPLGAMLAPVQSAISATVGNIQKKFGELNESSELERSYNAALQELAAISVKTARYDEVVAENERLRALMNNYEKYSQYEPIFARVIGKDTGNWFCTFTVNRGSADGVSENMTVMSAEGVVGRVVETGLNYAKVMSIIDGSSGAAALIERNRDNGVVRGMVDDTTGEYLLQMNYLTDVNDVRTGDTVLTSGLDGVFIKGLPIGRVTQISRQSSGLSQYVVLTPFSDFEHIEEVILLKPQA